MRKASFTAHQIMAVIKSVELKYNCEHLHESLNNPTPAEHRLQHPLAGISKKCMGLKRDYLQHRFSAS